MRTGPKRTYKVLAARGREQMLANSLNGPERGSEPKGVRVTRPL